MPLIGGPAEEKADYIHARNAILPRFRRTICERIGITPFEHQAAWWAATDGLILTDLPARPEDPPDLTQAIRLPDLSIAVRRLIPRERRARYLADLPAYKAGKSLSAAIWASAFAIVPGAKIELVGLEYDTCSPEFEYMIEILLSSRGFGLKAASVQNRPRDGKMWIDLDNGVQYIARSWERKDAMKGKERDAYIFCESFQLPGMDVFTSNKQNLDARRGYAIFPTTPDRPWITELHTLGHDPKEPDWACFCGIPRSVNPYAFDAEGAERDRRTMTREKYQIHYGGQIGEYVGSVFGYQQGSRIFTTETHPHLWKDLTKAATPSNLRIPDHWEVLGATDSGTFYSSLFVAFDDFGNAYVLDEYTNYRYVVGEIELLDNVNLPNWARRTFAATKRFRMRPELWSDRQNQLKVELRRYGLIIRSARRIRETRTEITREYFKTQRIFLAPWLTVLPVELEQAQWPEGFDRNRVERRRRNDHTLDDLEHILVQRPIGKKLEVRTQHRRFRDQLMEGLKGRRLATADPHGL